VSPRRLQSRVSHDRWLVSYADFITLLFAFFVVLYSSAQTDKLKQHKISQAIDSAFQSLGLFSNASRKTGAHPDSAKSTDASLTPMNIVMGDDVMAPAQVKEDLEKIQRQMEQLLSDKIAQHTVSIRMGRDGLIISLREAGFFASGSATPQPQTLPTLRRIASALSQTSYDLRVEGHTDNVPIHTAEFDSNWELSSSRATHIARMLIDIGAIEPTKISAAGYAEFHPTAINDTAEGRSQNRRVDLVVLPRSRVNFNPDVLKGLSNTGSASDLPSGQWRRITDDDQSTSN
jgi:chemotaxis protein MotB